MTTATKTEHPHITYFGSFSAQRMGSTSNKESSHVPISVSPLQLSSFSSRGGFGARCKMPAMWEASHGPTGTFRIGKIAVFQG